MNLERLETRTVLSDVTVTFPAMGTSSGLLIQGDQFNDNFVITENNNGTVTVSPGTPALNVGPPTSLIPPSTINLAAAPFTTQNPVSSIIVQLQGTNNIDIVTLNSQSGAASPTVSNVTVSATGPKLTFNVSGVHNSGFLQVSNIASTNQNGVLLMNEQNSSFASQTVNQFGNGPDFSSVMMTNDVTPGKVSVALGNANKDNIALTTDTFGETTLIEGNGGPANPVAGTSLGNSDTITVTGGKYTNLFAQQKLDGTFNKISISNIQVAFEFPNLAPAHNPAGVTTIQGNGAGDNTTITGVTTFVLNGLAQTPAPPNTGLANINVTQGNGSVGLSVLPGGGHPAAVNDVASVSNSIVPGFISITQSDLLSNSPSYNTATITGDTAGGALSIKQGDAGGVIPVDSSGHPLPVTQGDIATISTSSGSSASIVQGMGLNDSASILNATIGSGGDSITQNDQPGNPGDQARIIGGTTTGSASTSQGGGIGDIAQISLTSIGGNASIGQGGGDGDVAQIVGAGTLVTPGTVNSGTIGGDASISQGNGKGDTGVIAYLTIGTAGTGKGNISVSQGNGKNDAGEIETVLALGGFAGSSSAPAVAIEIEVTQGDGANDIAAIVGLTAPGGGTFGAATDIEITQGKGNADWAEVADVKAAFANVTITQNDQASNPMGDTAYVLNTNVGFVGPNNADLNGTGNVTITQGDAPGDVALVAGSPVSNDPFSGLGQANNVVITQGLNNQTFNGSTVASDVAQVDDEIVTSNITVTQGNANSVGLYLAAIGFDFVGMAGLGTVPPLPTQFTPVVTPSTGSSPVTAGGDTQITQFGFNNIVLLGDTNSSFSTTFLDVFTGLGGAFVQVLNTTTFGPLFQAFSIDGLGMGNTLFIDLNSFFGGVTFNTSTFNAQIG
jgi:hypothetical protein